MEGTVVYWNAEKKYGFIDNPENEKDIFFFIRFVDYSDKKLIREGIKVEFNTEMQERGPMAKDIKVVR